MNELRAEMERCRDWIEAALEHSGGTHDFDDILDAVSRGVMQFWPAHDACAVTEILVFPKKKALHIFLAGGNMETIVDMNDSAEHFAKMNGCSLITIAGRKGWSRQLKDHGYNEFYTALAKDI